MPLRKKSSIFLVLLGIFSSSFASAEAIMTAEQREKAEHGSVKSEVLMKAKTSWDGTLYKAYPSGQPELTVVKVTIPPHTHLPWHTHPAPNVAYITSGSIVVEKKENGEKRELKKGDFLAETVDIPHRGTTGSEPVEILIVYSGTEGVPNTVHLP